MPVVLSFGIGFVLAQLGWWLAARGTMSPGDVAAMAGAPAFRFIMLAGVELLAASIAFGVVMTIASRSQLAAPSVKSCLLALAAGAVTATVAAGPYALIPRIVAGEAQMLIWIVAAVIVSSAFGALIGAAFREPVPENT